MSIDGCSQKNILAQYLRLSTFYVVLITLFFTYTQSWVCSVSGLVYLGICFWSWKCRSKDPAFASWLLFGALLAFGTITTVFTGGIGSPLLTFNFVSLVCACRLIVSSKAIVLQLGITVASIIMSLVFKENSIFINEISSINHQSEFYALIFIGNTFLATIFGVVGEKESIRAREVAIYHQNQVKEILLRKNKELKEEATLKNSMALELQSQKFALNEHALVSIADANGKIIYANGKFCKISQYSPEEIIGRDHRVINSGVHSKEFFKNLWGTIKSGNVWKGEICNRAKDGSLYWIAATIVAYKDLEGNISQYVAIRTDITEQKAAEQKIKDAMLKVRESAKAKSEFLANMSHEIRTPMNGLLGMIALLKDTNLDAKQQDMINTIDSCGSGLLTILNDVLDFSKIDSGKLEMESIEFDLYKTIDDLKVLSSLESSKKGVALVVNIDPNVPRIIKGDATRLKQIIGNFLSNAVKFTYDGKVTLSARTVKVDDKKNYINFSVADTGIGIKKENQQKLFEEFSQADSSTTRKFGGTGLGLAISSKLTTAMNGFIGVESEEGQGARFFVTIPFEKVMQVNHAKNENIESTATVDSKKSKVLVVEDNKINQKIILMTLEKLGVSAELASNGLEAIELVERKGANFFDVIFMDLQMPVMDGLSATTELLERYSDCSPIVAMTANAFVEDRKRCFAAGMKDFISKPFKIDDVKQVLAKFSRKNSDDLAS